MKSTMIDVPISSYTIKGVFTEAINANGPCAILLHPHPRYGGDISNPVISQLEQVCQEYGMSTFKFSFRGVQSNPFGFEGITGSLKDTITCIDYLENEFKISSFGLIGYSYGGSVALLAAILSKAEFLVTLSASATLFKEAGISVNELMSLKCPIMMFHGVVDRVVLIDDMDFIRSYLKSNVISVPLEGEGHFYERSLPIVKEQLRQFLSANVTPCYKL